MYIVMICLMSFLIKWKLEKLLKRRDLGKIILKQPQEITSKIHCIVETLKRGRALSAFEGFALLYATFIA